MDYYQITNAEKGFTTHEDNKPSSITQFPGGIWGIDMDMDIIDPVELNMWINQSGVTPISLEDAQSIVDATLQLQYDIEVEAYKPEYTSFQQKDLNLVKRINKARKKNNKKLLEVPIFEPLNEKPVLKVITLS